MANADSGWEKHDPSTLRGKNAGSGLGGCGWLLIGAVALIVAFIVTAALGEDPPPSVGDASARVACEHYRNITYDADVLTGAHLLAKIQEVNSSASVSEYAPVRNAAYGLTRDAVAGLPADDSAVALTRACNPVLAGD